jgi:DNA-binding transcriptional MerR regulator
MALRFKGLSVRECEELAREQHEEPNDENEEEMTYHIEGRNITVETKDEEQMKEIIDFLQERGKEC